MYVVLLHLKRSTRCIRAGPESYIEENTRHERVFCLVLPSEPAPYSDPPARRRQLGFRLRRPQPPRVLRLAMKRPLDFRVPVNTYIQFVSLESVPSICQVFQAVNAFVLFEKLSFAS